MYPIAGGPSLRLSRFLFFTLGIPIAFTGCELSAPDPTFQTPTAFGTGTAFVFTAAGDYAWTEETAATLELMARSGASFNLALGDFSYNSVLPESSWCDFVQSKVGDSFPFQLLAGNHEDDFGGDGHIENFATCLPDRIGVRGTYGVQYYFDYELLARFIMISPDRTVNGRYYFYGEGEREYRWLADAIEGARRANIPWVIVGMHVSCLSMGVYYCETDEELLDLLIEKKVDLVLHAHDHTYQRSKQLAKNRACSVVEVEAFDRNCVVDDGSDDHYVKGAGALFIVVGTAGAELYEIDTGDPEAGYFAKWMGANIHPRKGFLKASVSASEIIGEFVGSTGTSDFTDRFTIRRRN